MLHIFRILFPRNAVLTAYATNTKSKPIHKLLVHGRSSVKFLTVECWNYLFVFCQNGFP